MLVGNMIMNTDVVVGIGLVTCMGVAVRLADALARVMVLREWRCMLWVAGSTLRDVEISQRESSRGVGWALCTSTLAPRRPR
jgi:hypothetical protein